jgi:cell division protein FtsW (lipid II flippase)|tara:strand:+ start:281 stop:538 length:258 start_codon:yes stop_codon:yes gene_type:complete
MNKDQAINQLRLRLLLLIIGLILSYIISFGLAIYFVLSTNYFKNDNGLVIISIGIVLLFMSFLHIRFQYRKYNLYLIRAHNIEEE